MKQTNCPRTVITNLHGEILANEHGFNSKLVYMRQQEATIATLRHDSAASLLENGSMNATMLTLRDDVLVVKRELANVVRATKPEVSRPTGPISA